MVWVVISRIFGRPRRPVGNSPPAGRCDAVEAEPGVFQVAAVQQRQRLERVDPVASLAGSRRPACPVRRAGGSEFGGAPQQRFTCSGSVTPGSCTTMWSLPGARSAVPQRRFHSAGGAPPPGCVPRRRHDGGAVAGAFATGQVVGVDLHQQVRAALQVEPQGQGAFGRRPAGGSARRVAQAGQRGAQPSRHHQAVGHGPDPESVHIRCL